MLRKFSVSNFKGFSKEIVFDLTKTRKYDFNNECIKNGIVNNAIIYGYNGSGKSNLSLAIFDIVSHLTDFYTNKIEYKNYSNGDNSSLITNFSYEFLFGSKVIKYNYKKNNLETIVAESFFIDDKEMAFIDRVKSKTAKFTFKGTENLNTNIDSEALSILKYMKNNTVLEENEENKCFLDFFQFVEGMLLFRSLQKNIFIGIENSGNFLSKDIIQKNHIKEFQNFLMRAGVKFELEVEKVANEEILVSKFRNSVLPFLEIASSGTEALLLFYYWLQRLRENKVSFLIIDEFDAFYHHELSEFIVKEIKKLGIQFILTTHNTSLISNDLLRPDCYFVIEDNQITSFTDSTRKELREAHNLEKLYKAGTFEK